MRRRLLRPRPAARRDRGRSSGALPLALALLLGIVLGIAGTRWSSAARAPQVEGSPVATSSCTTSSVAPSAAIALTGLCPCPTPPPARRPVAARSRRAPEPGAARPHTPGDPTAEVARYLREQATRFSPCAPPAGAPLRLHLELSIQPNGALESVRIANIEPLPPAVVACAEQTARALTPPPFEGAVTEVFSLTLVL